MSMPGTLPNPTPDRSALDDERLIALRENAASHRHRFVDPTRVGPVQAVVAQLPHAWVSRVLGREVTNPRTVPWGQMIVLADAAVLDGLHLEHLSEGVHAAMTDQLQRERAEQRTGGLEQRTRWNTLCAQLPVEVFVGLNWAFGYQNGSNRGRSHIVVQQFLNHGRLHRAARTALCETPSRNRTGPRGLDPLRALDRGPDQAVGPGDADRIPDCSRCLKIAHGLVGRKALAQ
ncbi:MAG: hypothetical protein WAW17_21640 [Rhodococcus sp. (in: high G+C Gram-positive bacteria)]|uniref:hypothetical protein n=1 Tax=Rhodococcus sp. TaxID=1831 RepID=UPI003BB12147